MQMICPATVNVFKVKFVGDRLMLLAFKIKEREIPAILFAVLFKILNDPARYRLMNQNSSVVGTD